MFASIRQCKLLLLIIFVSTVGISQAAISPVHYAIDLSIENARVQQNQTFNLAVEISDVTGLDVKAFNLTILYDPALVTATDVTLDGTLSGSGGAEMTLVHNIESGRISIATAGVNALVGSGSIAIISFRSLNRDGTADVSFEEFVLNEGLPDVSGNSGTITISSELPGDASLNGEVSAFDASLVLQHAALLNTLPTDAFLAADVSGNGDVSSFDASLILQQVTGLIDCFPVEASCNSSKTDSRTDALAEFKWGAAEPDGMLVHMPLTIDKIQGTVQSLTVEIIASEEIDFTYDLSSRLPEGWIISHSQQTNGNVRIAMAGGMAIEPGTLFMLQVSEPQLMLNATVTINEQQELALDELTFNETPEDFALGQNYPNPFNPATTISYALLEDIQVSLTVFDMLGREVARLVDRFQEAGTHAISFDASKLPSGMYMYRLEAGAFSETRQMTLIK